MLCPFHNLVLLSTVKLSYGLTSVGTNWATWQIERGKVCVTITHYNFKCSSFLLLPPSNHKLISILALESLIYMYKQFLTWAGSSLALCKDFSLNSQCGLKEFGKLCQCFRTRTQVIMVFSGQILISLLHQQFSQQKGPNPKAECSRSNKSSRILLFLAFTVSAVNLNNVFSSCLWDNPFFFLLDLFLTTLKANEYGIFWNEVCVWRLGGVSSCFLSFCSELLFHRRRGVLQTDRTMLYSAVASNHKQGLWN